MDNYICNICGFSYNAEIGDADFGVEVGIEFTDLPDTWKCPLCGADSSEFSKESI